MIADSTLVKVPIWVLKNKIERDFEEYAFLCQVAVDAPEDNDEPEEFPLYDSTIEALKILSEIGVEFDTKTGQWKD